MATVKQIVGSFSAVTVTGLSTLASATYVQSNDVDNTTNQPVDLLVMLEATPGTVGGNKQAVLFAQAGDTAGSNLSTGPTSGTTTTDEPNLVYIGTLPLNTNATQQRRYFGVAAAFGGVLPPHLKFVVKNDCGVAFTAAALKAAEISVTVA
jgi:hypothetical protein